jgi:hypothetical protein
MARYSIASPGLSGSEGKSANRQALYLRSPNPSWNSAATSRIARASSGPSASRRTTFPIDADSSITATMLRALARRPPAMSVTSQRKREAISTTLAHAQACKPSQSHRLRTELPVEEKRGSPSQ